MLKILDHFYINSKIRMAKFVDQFKKDETGVAAIVATVLLILIVVLLAALFWDKISQWFNDTWDKILGQSNTIG